MTAGRSGATGERLKVGIVGGGGIAQVAHLPVLKKMRGVEVQAICDTDLPKARALADRFGVKDAFDDIEELLRYETLDAVVVCSPTHLHEAHIQAALSANLHVLVEKPLAMSATGAQRILRAVEKHNRVVMVGMNHRYRADVQIVRSFVQSGELGTIESVRGSWHVFRPGRAQLGWRQRRDQAGGGAMLDLGLSITANNNYFISTVAHAGLTYQATRRLTLRTNAVRELASVMAAEEAVADEPEAQGHPFSAPATRPRCAPPPPASSDRARAPAGCRSSRC